MSDVCFLVRKDGPDELQWCGVGPASIGITDLPRNVPITVKPIAFRSPSGEGSNKAAGSKNENVKMGKKTASEIINDIKREFPNFTWELFDTRAEAVQFVASGLRDYQVLGVEPGSSADEIRSAYLTKSKQHHPDLGGDTKKFQEVAAAYQRLSR